MAPSKLKQRLGTYISSSVAGENVRSQSVLRCVMGKDKVARFDRFVAREACFQQGLICRFAIFELSETPAARGGVFSGVLDHKLNVRS